MDCRFLITSELNQIIIYWHCLWLIFEVMMCVSIIIICTLHTSWSQNPFCIVFVWRLRVMSGCSIQTNLFTDIEIDRVMKNPLYRLEQIVMLYCLLYISLHCIRCYIFSLSPYLITISFIKLLHTFQISIMIYERKLSHAAMRATPINKKI